MENPIVIIIIFLLILTSITMFILAISKPKEQEDIANRLEKLRNQNKDSNKTNNSETKKKLDLKSVFSKTNKTLNPIAKKIAERNNQDKIKEKLIKAGKYETSPVNFVASQLSFSILAPTFFIIFNLLTDSFKFDEFIIIVFLSAGMGYIYPLAKLGREITDRQTNIFKALPDTIDLLNICLEAGMGINGALTKVVEKGKESPLRDEIEATLGEIKVGKPRLDALRDMSKRVGVKELSSVIVSIVQSEQMGTSLSNTLKIQGEIIRDVRWQKAQELAQKAPVKIIIPVAIFIFPTIFIVIFGPMAIAFMTGNY